MWERQRNRNRRYSFGIGEGLGEGFLYREAYTTDAANEVLDRLKSYGLHRDGGSGHETGKIVFVYRPTPAVRPAPASDHTALPGRAAWAKGEKGRLAGGERTPAL